MLVCGTNHDASVIVENVFGTVSVVHIEIDNGDAPHTLRRECVSGANSDVIEKAKTHRFTVFGVVSRGANAAERVPDLPFNDQLGCENHGASGVPRRLGGVGVHVSIRVDVHQALLRRFF